MKYECKDQELNDQNAVMRCSECEASNTTLRAENEERCICYDFKCNGCGKNVRYSRQWFQFGSAPPVLTIHILRTKCTKKKMVNKATNSVQVESHLGLWTMGDGCEELHRYQIESIVCHQGMGVNTGHCITYIRCGDTWWLHDDEKVQKVENIEEKVDSTGVHMCFYIPVGTEKVKPMAEVLIGRNLKLNTRSTKNVIR